MSRVFSFSFLALAAAALVLGSARAWDGHGLIRRLALQDLAELRALPAVPVTPLTVEIPGIRPGTSFPFVGASPGELQAPRDILVSYAQEPDWGMDQDLRTSWQQRFMGGYEGPASQGYFHMYYPSVTLHLPVPVLSMGAAPRRAAQWAEMSRRAFARGDEYWGWRFMAWALHFVEDLGQPYHSSQTSRRFVRLRDPIRGTTNCTANFHLTYEQWLERRLSDELAGGPDLGLCAALGSQGEFRARDLEEAVKQVARRSHRVFGGLARDSVAFFGERFLSSERVIATEEELDRLEPGETLGRILGASRYCLAQVGRAVRAMTRRAVASRAAGRERRVPGREGPRAARLP